MIKPNENTPDTKNFALIGAAGFIAVRHMKAIKDTGNRLIAALDKFDSVGVIDSYFPEANFFTEFERFDRHMDKLKRTGTQIDYVSICTPNYLHDSHIRFALRHRSDAICEKPLVLNPWNLDALAEIEKETDKKIFNILQLRLHPAIAKLKEEIGNGNNQVYDIDLTYITSRGNWYFQSWKADMQKSGGIATNIGVHFFDMLVWIFGKVKNNTVHVSETKRAAGFLQLERANVRWFMSLDYADVPRQQKSNGQRTFRSIKINDTELEFSEGFTDLHTVSYKHILEGKGFGLDEVRNAIEIVYAIRNAAPIGLTGEYHTFIKK
jgi:UDP-N-acetyl-2-amino-2-deoxyglucuronate dehydrogenase